MWIWCESGEILSKQFWCASRENRPYSLCRCHTKRRMGAAPILLLAWHRLLQNIIYDVSRVKFWNVTYAHPSFGMTATKTLRSIFLWRASAVLQIGCSPLGNVNQSERESGRCWRAVVCQGCCFSFPYSPVLETCWTCRTGPEHSGHVQEKKRSCWTSGPRKVSPTVSLYFNQLDSFPATTGISIYGRRLWFQNEKLSATTLKWNLRSQWACQFSECSTCSVLIHWTNTLRNLKQTRK